MKKIIYSLFCISFILSCQNDKDISQVNKNQVVKEIKETKTSEEIIKKEEDETKEDIKNEVKEKPKLEIEDKEEITISFLKIKSIIEQKCTVCHSAKPTHPGRSRTAGGVELETNEQIKAKASRINSRTVNSKSMPPGNVTNISDEEIKLIGTWFKQGAKID